MTVDTCVFGPFIYMRLCNGVQPTRYYRSPLNRSRLSRAVRIDEVPPEVGSYFAATEATAAP